MEKEAIRDIVKQVLQELQKAGGGEPSARPAKQKRMTDGPNILNLFHAGVGKLDVALEQVRQLETIASRSSVYTDASARSWVCGGDVRDKAGTQCILDTVKADGLEKVLQRADILVLPTFCFKVAAKVARMTFDTEGSSLVMSALMQGKQVVATRDGFLFLERLSNEALKNEVRSILDKLESFGMILCATEDLYRTVKALADQKKDREAPGMNSAAAESAAAAPTLVTAKEIQAAVDANQTVIHVAAGGIVTPLARDQAREYGIQIKPSDENRPNR
jgi:transcriptional regulator with GAF, ATPase, and Fis domain